MTASILFTYYKRLAYNSNWLRLVELGFKHTWQHTYLGGKVQSLDGGSLEWKKQVIYQLTKQWKTLSILLWQIYCALLNSDSKTQNMNLATDWNSWRFCLDVFDKLNFYLFAYKNVLAYIVMTKYSLAPNLGLTISVIQIFSRSRR